MVLLVRVLISAASLLWLCTAADATITLQRLPGDSQMRILIVRGEFTSDDNVSAFITEALDYKPTVITFDSPGGSIETAMRFGRVIRRLGLSTLQIRAGQCASACTLAFMGGVVRFAEPGSIGVHQSFFPSTSGMGAHDAVSAVQAVTAGIISYMIEMGVDPGLLQLSLSIDSSDVRYLTTAEMRQYRVTTDGAPGGAFASAAPAVASPAPTIAPAVQPSPAPSVDTSRTIASIDDQQRLPNRLAIYKGLDFLGRDIGSASVADGAACAKECFSNRDCKAFTFNIHTRQGKGPNCFIKSSQGQLDGNSAAISGLLLAPLDPDPQTVYFGAIDPATSLYGDTDIPGFDLSRRPEATARTPFDCRMACINNGRCAAFTFVSKKKECWLKSQVGTPRTMAGAVTGAKLPMTYTPESIPLR